jgi:hypothetical protein
MLPARTRPKSPAPGLYPGSPSLHLRSPGRMYRLGGAADRPARAGGVRATDQPRAIPAAKGDPSQGRYHGCTPASSCPWPRGRAIPLDAARAHDGARSGPSPGSDLLRDHPNADDSPPLPAWASSTGLRAEGHGRRSGTDYIRRLVLVCLLTTARPGSAMNHAVVLGFQTAHSVRRVVTAAIGRQGRTVRAHRAPARKRHGGNCA